MKKKSKIIYNKIEFDSNEELLFYYYLEELNEANFVKNFEYNTKSFILSEPVKYTWLEKKKNKEIERESTFLHEHIYTPDFYIVWNEKAEGIFYKSLFSKTKLTDIPFVTIDKESYIEIKPAFDFKNMTRLSVINQKWMFKDKKIYIQKVIPIAPNKNCLFAKTFVPYKALFTEKTKKRKTFKFQVRSLQEFINKGDFNGKK